MESQSKSSAHCGDFGPKRSWIFSFLSLLLIVALFIRMEAINNKTEMNEMRISNVESNMKIMTFQPSDDGEEMKSLQDSRKKLASTKVRRSLIPASNSSLSIDDIHREINKHIKQLKPQSLCHPSEKVCVPGPPGKKGSRGSRGRRGAPGDKGKKGAQGIMGPPGRHGKQGIMGDPGIKGEKGEKGAEGPQGMTGLKGDPGESISIPEVFVSPDTRTVSENQTTTFYCSASGNPQPKVTWTKVKGSLARSHITQSGRLDVTHSTYNDSGDYKCTAVNILGRDQKIVKLIVEVGPRLTKALDRFLVIKEEAVASLSCEAFSYPPSVVTWTRPLAALPKGRSSVRNGVLTIQDFSIADTGTYVCTAKNKLGSVTAVTTLNIQRKPVSCEAVVSRHSTSGTFELKINSKRFEVYCDVTSQGTSWTLIARFSNNDGKTWMRDDGLWWYDQSVAMGTTTNPSVNADMISPAFWLVRGGEFKITRSDDSSHMALLQTTGNCLGGQTFRSKITSYGDFRNGKVWSSNQCLGSCTVQYGGQYKTTDGFKQAACSGNIQSSNKIGFWCDWDAGDGSVMMIGGGGSACQRADHGIGITEDEHASFVYSSVYEYDFGNEATSPQSQSYSLNLWIR